MKTTFQLIVNDLDELPIRLGTQSCEFRHIRDFAHDLCTLDARITGLDEENLQEISYARRYLTIQADALWMLVLRCR